MFLISSSLYHVILSLFLWLLLLLSFYFFFTLGEEGTLSVDDEGEVRYGFGFLELQKNGSILLLSIWLPLQCILSLSGVPFGSIQLNLFNCFILSASAEGTFGT